VGEDERLLRIGTPLRLPGKRVPAVSVVALNPLTGVVAHQRRANEKPPSGQTGFEEEVESPAVGGIPIPHAGWVPLARLSTDKPEGVVTTSTECETRPVGLAQQDNHRPPLQFFGSAAALTQSRVRDLAIAVFREYAMMKACSRAS